MKFYLLICCLFFCTRGFSASCEKWFEDLNLKTKSASCVSKCQVALVDMSSFECHEKCDQFCELEATYYLLKKYGLTAAEIEFCEGKAFRCARAYALSVDANRQCQSIYNRSGTNDESDACRHFVWAILLAQNLGVSDAESILNAHENNPLQPVGERAMDTSNNRWGLLTFNRLKKEEADLSEKNVLDAFKKSLRDKSLIVNQPKYSDHGGVP